MNVRWWKVKNFFHKAKDRIKHPPPWYKRVGGVEITVNRANGKQEKLGTASHTYAKRWGVGSGQ